MEGFYKVPAKVWEELIDTYRDQITDNTQLTKAAKLAAEKNLWLASGYPPSVINANIKPVSRELGHLTKRLREEGEDEGEPTPARIIKASPKTLKSPKQNRKPVQEDDCFRPDPTKRTLNPRNENGKPKSKSYNPDPDGKNGAPVEN